MPRSSSYNFPIVTLRARISAEVQGKREEYFPIRGPAGTASSVPRFPTFLPALEHRARRRNGRAQEPADEEQGAEHGNKRAGRIVGDI